MYKDDIRSGFCKYYWENGNLQSKGYFNGNSVEGEFRSYYHSGALYEIQHYDNNVKNGWSIYFDITGIKRSESLYKDGMSSGLFKLYDSLGILTDSAFAFESYENNTKTLHRLEYVDARMQQLRTEYFYSSEKYGGESPYLIRHYSKGALIKEERL